MPQYFPLDRSRVQYLHDIHKTNMVSGNQIICTNLKLPRNIYFLPDISSDIPERFFLLVFIGIVIKYQLIFWLSLCFSRILNNYSMAISSLFDLGTSSSQIFV